MTSALMCLLVALYILSRTDSTEYTIVQLFGKVVKAEKGPSILLTCSSSRKPKGQNAEFLMNNSSVDSITLNDITGKCTHLHGECIADKCNCSSSGKTFARFFLIKRLTQMPLNLSCDMRFEDKAKSVVFSKIPTLSFDGKEFKNRGTHTDVTKITDGHNCAKDKDEKTVEVVIAVIGALAVVATILAAGVYSHMKNMEKGKIKWEKEEINKADTTLTDMEKRKIEWKKEEINNADTALTELKDTIIQEYLNRSHGNKLQYKTYGEESGEESGYKTESADESKEDVYIQARDKLTSQSIPHNTDSESQTNTDQQTAIIFSNSEGESEKDEAFASSDEDSYFSSGSFMDSDEDNIQAKLIEDVQHQKNRLTYVAGLNQNVILMSNMIPHNEYSG